MSKLWLRAIGIIWSCRLLLGIALLACSLVVARAEDKPQPDWLIKARRHTDIEMRKNRFLLKHAEGKELLEEQRELERLIGERTDFVRRDVRSVRYEYSSAQKQKLEEDEEYREASSRLAQGKAELTEKRAELLTILGQYGVTKNQIYRGEISQEDILALGLNEDEAAKVLQLLNAIKQAGLNVRERDAGRDAGGRTYYLQLS